jgi:serine/threonine protein kinase
VALAHAHDCARQLALGEIVGDRYRVLGFLGSGGMGEVYEVEHVSLGRHFALKLLHRELMRDPSIVKRFTREARAMAAVESEHVVGIVDFGETLDHTPYFVMERLRGYDLKVCLTEFGPMPSPQAANIIIDACMGLRAAHEAGLVHRDLKPANLFVTRRDNGQDCCKILDLGVVKSIAADSTQQGSLVGTIKYMAPEQILEDGVVGPWTDIYALGAILYECLTAQLPFPGSSAERIMFKILNEGPQPLDQIRSDIPSGMGKTVARALARDRNARFASAMDFALALGPFADRAMTIGRRNPSDEVTIAAVPKLDRECGPISEGSDNPAEAIHLGISQSPQSRRLRAIGVMVLSAGFVGIGSALMLRSSRTQGMPVRHSPVQTQIVPQAPPSILVQQPPQVQSIAGTSTGETLTQHTPQQLQQSDKRNVTPARSVSNPSTRASAVPTPIEAPLASQATPTVKSGFESGAPCTRSHECASRLCVAERCR